MHAGLRNYCVWPTCNYTVIPPPTVTQANFAKHLLHESLQDQRLKVPIILWHCTCGHNNYIGIANCCQGCVHVVIIIKLALAIIVAKDVYMVTN